MTEEEIRENAWPNYKDWVELRYRLIRAEDVILTLLEGKKALAEDLARDYVKRYDGKEQQK